METKKNYYTQIKNNQEFGEAEILYKAMQNEPEKAFTSKDVAELFPESGVSIASRLFKKLEINGLIYLFNTNKKNFYKIVDTNKSFLITKSHDENHVSLSKAQKRLLKAFKDLMMGNPTRKHTRATMRVLGAITDKLNEGEKLEDITVIDYFDIKDLPTVPACDILDRLERG